MTHVHHWGSGPYHKILHVLAFHPVGSHQYLHCLDPDILLIEIGYLGHMQLNTVQKGIH
jgi:hypothetical protein